jgi:hypothetical protein
MTQHPERTRAPTRVPDHVPDHVRRPCHAIHVRQARFVSGLRGRRRGRADRRDWVAARIGVVREDRARHRAGGRAGSGSGAQEDEEHYGDDDQHRPKHQPRHDPEIALHLLVRRHQFVQAGVNHIQVAV